MKNEKWGMENWGGGGNGRDARCPSGGKRNGQDVRCPSSGELSTGLARGAKKAEGKKRNAPTTPKEKKGRVKKQDGGFKETRSSKTARARARAKRPCSCSFREAGEAVAEIVTNCFPDQVQSARLWAWYCRHFNRHAIIDRAYYYASCQRCGEVRNAVTAFQAWLRRTFGDMAAAQDENCARNNSYCRLRRMRMR